MPTPENPQDLLTPDGSTTGRRCKGMLAVSRSSTDFCGMAPEWRPIERTSHRTGKQNSTWTKGLRPTCQYLRAPSDARISAADGVISVAPTLRLTRVVHQGVGRLDSSLPARLQVETRRWSPTRISADPTRETRIASSSPLRRIADGISDSAERSPLSRFGRHSSSRVRTSEKSVLGLLQSGYRVPPIMSGLL